MSANAVNAPAIFIPKNWIRPVSDIVQSVIAQLKPGLISTNTTGPANQAAGSQQQQQPPGQSGLPLPLPSIPISKLFDPYAPRTITAQLTLEGETAESLLVDVAVSGQAKAENGTAVVAPQVSCATATVPLGPAAFTSMCSCTYRIVSAGTQLWFTSCAFGQSVS
jgi:hypothetical protein